MEAGPTQWSQSWVNIRNNNQPGRTNGCTGLRETQMRTRVEMHTQPRTSIKLDESRAVTRLQRCSGYVYHKERMDYLSVQ